MRTDAVPTILIDNGTVLTLNATNEVLAPGYVYLEGGRIASVGQGPPPGTVRHQAQRVLDASQMAVLPGMVNSHVHLFQSFVRGPGGDRPLLPWLREVAWPVFENMTPQDIHLAAKISLVENIRGGATAVIDNHYVHPDGADDAVFQAAEDIGIRYMMARGWADHDYHPPIQETPAQILDRMERLYHTWHGQAGGRLRLEFGPLIPWGCTAATLQRTHALAQAWGVGTHIHTAETRAEVDMSLKSTGQRHVEWLAGLGLLGPQTQLVHSVWLSDHEIELISQSGAVVVHCPASNMFLASGIPKIAQLQRAGVSVALATDGQACNSGQEMVDLLGLTANLQKVGTLDALALAPESVLRMACLGGAMAFGQPERLGSLEPGKAADVVLVDLNNPRTMIVQDLPASLVNFARQRDIRTVIVAGRILMHDGQITILDEGALLQDARAAYRDLLRRAGVDTIPHSGEK